MDKSYLQMEVQPATSEKLIQEWQTYCKAVGKHVNFSQWLGEKIDKLYDSKPVVLVS